jgi:hypothetical protein
MKDVGLVAIAALTALALAAGGTDAQTNPPPPGSAAAKQKAGAAPTIAVTVTNRRGVGVSEFDTAQAGSAVFKAVLKKLGPGKSAVVMFPRDENCSFDLYVKWDDGTTSNISAFDICLDGKVNLVE